MPIENLREYKRAKSMEYYLKNKDKCNKRRARLHYKKCWGLENDDDIEYFKQNKHLKKCMKMLRKLSVEDLSFVYNKTVKLAGEEEDLRKPQK
jgi:hypothetical protein